MIVPKVDDVDRITRLDDSIVRNLQITQCYYEISQSVARFDGHSANWCTFATWASKQAGQTIRTEDLVRTFEERFYLSTEISLFLENIVNHLRSLGAKLEAHILKGIILRALNPAAAFARASDAVARGNKKVFEEIGREFTRFLDLFRDDTKFDAEKMTRFCAGLRPGEPPDGQRLLGEAFSAYYEARFEGDAKEKPELMLLANLRAGFHEQIRLQPEIAEALNAPLASTEELKRKILAVLLPGFWIRSRYRLTELWGRRLPLDSLLDGLVQAVNRLIRQVTTAHLMTLHLPGGEVLRLGRNLSTIFPQELAQIRNPKLREMLARADATPDSLSESGAEDWANFEDRMHFITDFFRAYQERQMLFDAPFTPEQVTILKSGSKPSGRL
ncbi:MAG TPA: hypothetical protein VLJ79_00200 [Candidatus Binatia bacterium]|nr:hypothetical protein [Candidatus Binatia bacterium]